MSIRILEEQVVNQIAAGEVVERPASAVKELVENAVDAQATAIEVSLADGGRERVRVVDDGIGMGRDDAMMCLERHATSKILRAEDLLAVDSLGFRGEALPSIAAVSRFALTTRSRDDDAGVRIRVEGGALRDVSPAGCAPGTTVDVRSLFYNLPARRKFLRARATERHHCVETVLREALGRPQIDFVVRHDGREVLRAPRASDRLDRARALLGPQARALRPVAFSRGSLRVEGLVAPGTIHRSTAAAAVYLYVNGRYVRDTLVRRAVYEAYRGVVPRGRYPLIVLDIRVEPADVDVNVHPTKTEVRFRQPLPLQRALVGGLEEALGGSGSAGPPRSSAVQGPLFGAGDARSAVSAAPPRLSSSREAAGTGGLWEGGRQEPMGGPPAHPDDAGPLPTPVSVPLPPALGAAVPPVVAERPESQLTAAHAPLRSLRLIGMLENRFILCEGEGLVVVDHERALVAQAAARLRRGLSEGGVRSQRLLAPHRLQLTPRQQKQVMEARESLSAIGIDIESLGPVFVIRGVPEPLPALDPARLAGALVDGLPLSSVEDLVPVVAQAACPEPLPPLDPYDARALLAELDEAGEGWESVSLQIPMGELERRIALE